MDSSILQGVIVHSRFEPVFHSFKYKHAMLMVNLEELEQDLGLPRIFRYNQWGAISIRSSNYIDNSAYSIKSKIEKIFANELSELGSFQIMLLTTPEMFGYSFNPVSFYFLKNDFDQVVGCASEVHNTFGESHLYLLDLVKQEQKNKWIFTHGKELYVSPFIERAGYYEFEINLEERHLDIQINLYQRNRKIFLTRFTGTRSNFTSINLLRAFFRIFVTVFTTEVRILIQAYTLFVRKKLVFNRRPSPSVGTVKSPSPGFISRVAGVIGFLYGERSNSRKDR